MQPDLQLQRRGVVEGDAQLAGDPDQRNEAAPSLSGACQPSPIKPSSPVPMSTRP